MLLQVDITSKSTPTGKPLFAGLRCSVEAGEKVAIIGRNGVGKTTLFGMLTGEDSDYTGDIIYKKGVRVVATRQEHHSVGSQTVVEYIVSNLPDYAHLKHIIDTYPDTMGDDMRKIEAYSNALEHFSSLDYYTVEDRIRQSLAEYQLGHTANRPLQSLSGGQKRFVELVRVEHSDADLALIDEPTNHMDYMAKAAFLQWFKNVRHAVVVITHDRDVLGEVSRIIEIKDMSAQSFKGNYSAYLKQNSVSTTTKMHDFEVTQRQIANLKTKIVQFRRLKERARDPDTIKQFKRREQQAEAELAQLQQIEKPSFWIDQESVSEMKPSIEASYLKHKARTIRIRRHAAAERSRVLLELDNVQVGYDHPLFKPLDLRVQTGDRLHIVGRNGVGKTTLVRTILGSLDGTRPATLLRGQLKLDSKLCINTYEQEISGELLQMKLGQAIEHIYDSYGMPSSTEHIMQTLGDYLFDPFGDMDQPVATLSGGQKARLQLIKLFANQPNLLILDEPTNHLDLPSIEELESTLSQYQGALLYISHDSHLAKNLGGEQLQIAPHQARSSNA